MRTLPALAFLVLLAGGGVDGQTIRYVDGLFVHDGNESVELIAWAELTSRGSLKMSRGSLEDAPQIHEVRRILSSIPLWKPVGAMVTSQALFAEERSERRYLAFATRKLNIYAEEVRVADLEQRETIDQLLKEVRASADAPGYAFIVLSGGDYQRFYPIRLTPAER